MKLRIGIAAVMMAGAGAAVVATGQAQAAVVPAAVLVNTAPAGPVGGATSFQATYPAGSHAFYLQTISNGAWVNVPITSTNNTVVVSSTSSGVVARGHFARIWGRSSLRLKGAYNGVWVYSSVVRVAGYRWVGLRTVDGLNDTGVIPTGSMSVHEYHSEWGGHSDTDQMLPAYSCSQARLGMETNTTYQATSISQYARWAVSLTNGYVARWNGLYDPTGGYVIMNFSSPPVATTVSVDGSGDWSGSNDTVEFGADFYCTR